MGNNTPQSKPKIRWKKSLFILVVGVLLVILAFVANYVFDDILISKINSNLVIKRGNSERFQQWKHPRVPINMEFYVFDIVNPYEVREGSPPVVIERGPYQYKEFLDKQNISFTQGGAFVSYNQKKWFLFDRKASCSLCDPSKDNITTINVPFVILSEIAKKYSILGPAIDWLLTEKIKEDLFMTRSVHEILWGYTDPVFEAFSDFKKKYHLDFIPDFSPLMQLQPNDTYDGNVTVDTGNDNVDITAAWEEWKGRKNLLLWGSSYANMINGSDGTQFSPRITTGDTLYFFAINLCRSIYLKFESSWDIKGINVLRFTTPKQLFQNASFDANNKAFCLTRCYPNGIIAGSKDCKPLDRNSVESPIIVSTPHFLIGDPYLRQQVGGLSPNKEKHGLFMSIEPMTGIPLQALIRLQINAYIQPVESITGTKGIKPSYVPLMWFSNNATVDDSTAKMFRKDIIFPKQVMYYSKIVLISVGCCLAVVSCIIFITELRRFRRVSRKPLLQQHGYGTLSNSNYKENNASGVDECSTLIQENTNVA